MTKRIEVSQTTSRAEKIKVLVGAGALGAAALGVAGVGIANELSKPDTHQRTVKVEFDEDTPTLYDAAIKLRRQGATESVRELQHELKAAEPGHDGVVHPGDIAEVQIDVPNDSE